MLRIAQITDLHLPVFANEPKHALDIDKEYELFKTTASKIIALDADILVITGDVLEIPETEDPAKPLWQSPAPYIENIISSYRKVYDILTASALKYVIIPGNHDRESAFWRVFDRNTDTTEINGYTIVCFSDTVDKNSVPVRKAGELGKLKKLLTDPTKLRQIHVQHYLLTDPPEDDYAYSYKDYEKLQQEIIDSGKVVCCLCGHYHKGTDLMKKSGTFFSAGPAFCSPHRKYRMYRIQGNSVYYKDYAV